MAEKHLGGPWRDENGNYHASTQTVPKEILTGPKGGRYYIDEKGKKHYIKKGTTPTVDTKAHEETKRPKIITHTAEVSDYEHEGDLEREIAYIKSLCPEAKNFKSWEEEDYEAESEYEEEYGELDEPIYRGFVSFDAPADFDYDH